MAARLFPVAATLLALAACASPAPPSIETSTPPPAVAIIEESGEQPATSPVPPAEVVAPPTQTQPFPPEVQEALARQALEQRNVEVVTAFYELVFQDHSVAEAFDRYVGEGYMQHSPGLPDGRAAVEASLTPYFQANPLARSEIKRVVAQGDFVVLHVHAKSDPVDRGRAVVEIFRVEDDRIVEHWDVIQTIPLGAANENTMF